jgi:hypothetical protein
MQEVKITIGVCEKTLHALSHLCCILCGKTHTAAPPVEEEEKPARKPRKPKAVEEDETEETEEDTEDDETDSDDEEETQDEDTDSDDEDTEEESDDDVISPEDLVKLKKALRAYSAKHSKEKAVKVLKKYAEASQDVKAEDFTKLMKELKK